VSPHAVTILGLLAVAGCSSSPPSTPALGAVLVQIGPGGDPGENDATGCNVATSASGVPTLVEDRGVGPEVTAPDGSEDEGGATVRVRCTVHPGPAGFSVDTSIATSDGVGAAILGTMSLKSSDVQATFEWGGATFVSQGPCSIDFSAAQGMDIEPGRVWAVVTCPRATDGRGNTCLAAAVFLFENCQT
jgi:hypothetical protein